MAEQELQNAAYMGIHQAAQQVLADPENKNILPKNHESTHPKKQKRLVYQTIDSDIFGIIMVEAWGERINIQNYTVDYGGSKNIAKLDGDVNTVNEAYYFFSRAQVDAKNINGKLYRRATAYILADDPTRTIHYLELPMSSYTFK